MSDWLIELTTTVSSPKFNLVCFPFAGGGTVNYAKWKSDLHPEIGLYAFNYPGRERFFGQPCVTEYKYLITHCVELLSPLTDVPMVLFGHSFGALTAYFVTLELAQRQLPLPLHLFLSGRVAPNCPQLERMAHLDNDVFKAQLIKRYQGIPQQLLANPEFLDIFMPIIRSDFIIYEQLPQVFKSYENHQVDCDITVFANVDDKPMKKDFLSWQSFTTQSHHHIDLKGGHFELLEDWLPLVQSINQLVS